VADDQRRRNLASRADSLSPLRPALQALDSEAPR
jgi:hypothetical protein